ncbi:hypothetical protein G6F59_018696 [Rhizopus arrhizus]|nr:hypothetical protein G6F59_018696 [Rhizopus arrhizus]
MPTMVLPQRATDDLTQHFAAGMTQRQRQNTNAFDDVERSHHLGQPIRLAVAHSLAGQRKGLAKVER